MSLVEMILYFTAEEKGAHGIVSFTKMKLFSFSKKSIDVMRKKNNYTCFYEVPKIKGCYVPPVLCHML